MSLCLHDYEMRHCFAPQITSHISFALQQFETPVPASKEDTINFTKKLLKHNITLAQYESTLTQSGIKSKL